MKIALDLENNRILFTFVGKYVRMKSKNTVNPHLSETFGTLKMSSG